MSFDPVTGGPCWVADIRRGALRDIQEVLRARKGTKMATFVKLTRPDGSALYVAPDQTCAVVASVTQFWKEGALTEVTLVDGKLHLATEPVPIVIALLRNPDAKA